MKDNNNQPEEIEEPSESQESSDDSDLNTLLMKSFNRKMKNFKKKL